MHVKVIRWDNGSPETPARGSVLHVPRLLLPFYERYNSSGITRDSRIAPTLGQNSWLPPVPLFTILTKLHSFFREEKVPLIGLLEFYDHVIFRRRKKKKILTFVETMASRLTLAQDLRVDPEGISWDLYMVTG